MTLQGTSFDAAHMGNMLQSPYSNSLMNRTVDHGEFMLDTSMYEQGREIKTTVRPSPFMFSPGRDAKQASSFFYEKGPSVLVNRGLKTVVNEKMYEEHQNSVEKNRAKAHIGTNIHKLDKEDGHLNQPSH